MARTVIILGAGCSKPAGAPVVADFLDRIDDVRKTLPVDSRSRSYFDQFLQTYNAILQSVQKSNLDLYNIEEIFSAFDIASVLSLDGNLNFQSDHVFSLRKVIQITLERSIAFPDQANQGFEPQPEYKGLAEYIRRKFAEIDDPPEDHLCFLTFNYDCLLEVALTHSGVPYSYGIDPADPHGATPVLKLHGSVNWREVAGGEIECDRIVSKNLHETRRSKSQLKPRSFQWLLSEQLYGPDNRVNPFVVPPTLNKMQYSKTLTKIWSSAARHLGTAENVVICGYSFPDTDHFFKYLFALGTMSDTILKKVLILNPDDRAKDRLVNILSENTRRRLTPNPDDVKEFKDLVRVLSYYGL